MIKVNAKHIRYALRFAAVEDVRYYLNGIHIRPAPTGGIIIEASDGHTAALFHDPAGECDKPAIIKLSPDAAKHCARRKHDRGDRQLIVDGERAAIVCDGEEQFVQPGDCRIDGKFPDITSVIAKLGVLVPGTPPTFDERLLRRFTFDKRDTQYGGLQLFHQPKDGGYSAIVIRVPLYPEFIGLLMPMHMDAMDPLPEWVLPVQRKEAA